MFSLSDLREISPYEWELPMLRDDMRVPVRLFASSGMLEATMRDKTLEQAVNAATLPGLVAPILVMPDMHEGYGFPIGGVGITSFPEGVISPGGIGYDINCGVRLLVSSIYYEDAVDDLDSLASAINQHCPSGVGRDGVVRLDHSSLMQICRTGAEWAVKKGFGTENDLRRTEDCGNISGADPEQVSERAKARGKPQLGSMGGGNHFIEVDLIEQIFDPQSAQGMGLQAGCLSVQIHSGSRGLGHQVCTDYVTFFQDIVKKYDIHLPDRELVCAPLDSQEGQQYLAAMRAAANYAFANRQILAHQIRLAFEMVFAGKAKNWHLNQVYDIAHNIGKIETHTIEGVLTKVCVHRKGATRAFAPDSDGLPAEYVKIGQPVLVPGSMGSASWVLAGTKEGMDRSFGSSCHGAGRIMSRHQAKKSIRGDMLRKDLAIQGIHIRAGSMSAFAEESPAAYKDVDAVVETVVRLGIARKIARLRPLVVIKG